MKYLPSVAAGLVLLTSVGCVSVTERQEPGEEGKAAAADLMQVDRDFSRLSAERGAVEAFALYLAKDAVMLPNEAHAIHGSRAICEQLAETFKDDIYHIHWKDLPPEMESQRGTLWGTGMGLIPLGTGAVDIAGVYEVLKDAPHVEYTTLEVAGDEAMLASYDYLKSLGAQ